MRWKGRILIVLVLVIFSIFYAMSATDSQNVFTSETINQRALDVAAQIEIYMEAHPDMTLADLISDKRFNELAVQQVGETGYTYLIVYETGILEFHPDPDIRGGSYNNFKTEFPVIWKILDKSLGSQTCMDSSGFYDWRDINDIIREKYTYNHCLNFKTADGYSLVLGVSTYMDEYSSQIEAYDSNLISSEISRVLSSVEQDLKFLSTLPALEDHINNPFDSDSENLESIFLNFAKSKPYYYQVRYIDESGMEVIRINNIESPEVVKKSDLQNKSGRYYVEHTLMLNDGDIYVSPFDLNIEEKFLENRGTEENHVYVPVIRYSTPLFDDEGNNKGMIILNIYGDSFLDILRGVGGSTYLTNRFGEFLFHPDGTKEFGFMFGQEINLNTEFNEQISKEILSSREGTFEFENKNFAYKKIYFPDPNIYSSLSSTNSVLINGEEYFWVLILEVKPPAEPPSFPLWGYFAIAFVLLILIISIINFLINKTTTQITGLSIRKRIFIYIALLGIVLLSLSGGFYYANSVSNLKQQAYNHLETAVDSRADHVETYFNDVISSAEVAATHETLTEAELAEIRDLTPSINSLFVLDGNGIVIQSSGETPCENDLSDSRAFIEGKQQTILINSYFCPIFEEEMMAVATPHAGGVLVARIEMSGLEDIVRDRTGLGETGEILAATLDEESGEIVFLFDRLFEDEAITGSVNELQETSYPMKSAISGEEAFFEESLDYRNEKIIAYSRYIEVAKVGIEAKVDYEEVIGQPARMLLYTSLLLIILGVFVSLAFSLFLSKRILNPILALEESTSKIQTGEFGTRVSIKTGDELEELGDTFNKMAQALEKTDQERKQVDKMKTEFLSITSHELRSPMTPMIAQLQMLTGNYFGKLNSEQKESLEIVLNNTKRLDRIIVDFLEISRIEAARLKFDFKSTSPAKVVNTLIEEMKNFMPEKKITLVPQISETRQITADPDRLGQVLRNLINNAIKFTHQKGKINIGVKEENGMILFWVEDNGVGIPKDKQARLFEPFYQVENMYQHKSGGTGLGLAISRGIVETQGGKIWLDSSPGKGTKFSFTVPFEPVKDIKPIKILFSEEEKTSENLTKVFNEFLGPLGRNELELLRKQRGLNQKSIEDYFSLLSSKGILDPETREEFKNNVLVTTGLRKKAVAEEDLEKLELVRKNQTDKRGKDSLEKSKDPIHKVIKKVNPTKKEMRKIKK